MKSPKGNKLLKRRNLAGWLDISTTIQSGMVTWPGDPKVEIKQFHSIEKGATANVSHISMGAHTGTHMDAPLHFLSNAKSIDTIPLDAAIGRSRVIEIHDRDSIKPDELKMHDIQTGERILFKTWNSERCWKSKSFVKDFVHISKDAAEFLASKKIKILGVDYLSVAGFFEDTQTLHQVILNAGIWIIEGLNLSGVKAGSYELICLPLKLHKGDGAPARAIIRPSLDEIGS